MDDEYIEKYGELFVKYKKYLPRITFEKFLESPKERTMVIMLFAVEVWRDYIFNKYK